MPIPPSVQELIERFATNADAYKGIGYNETNTRIDFINPFFTALGWDMNNTSGKPENHRDVIHEDKITIDGRKKAPDYTFRAGGQRRFFVEAKQPAINIYTKQDSAFQVRRYGWSAGLPLSILTDFEEFSIYDCRIQPTNKDQASIARLNYYTYAEYETKWDEIAELFSADAVYKGSLDTYIAAIKPQRGTITVDNAFLRDIESWRELLAKNIAAWNKNLDQRALNTAVQLTLDRIIFLRICEDRDTEPYERLLGITRSGNIYKQLINIFKDADDRYNSGLFHFLNENGRHTSPDTWTLTLHIDDEPLREIIRKLYYPASPYAFSVIPVEILGQVYEQFLGKIIHLNSNRTVTVEDKPDVKKAGGVFYTPTYIVDYIVKYTLDPLLLHKTPINFESPSPSEKRRHPKILANVDSLTILDPSCGSGSFLLGAYQYLLDWYRQWYIDNSPDNYPKVIYKTINGDWKLTAQERKRILINHIYGVDIDAQAVEVTKLSLMLKVLEGETGETINTQLYLLKERALPDLDYNIRCGNSLIAPDYYLNHKDEIEIDEIYRINAFDWDREFSKVMASGGFDAIIGNPPYISVELTQADFTHYYLENYPFATARTNSFDLFIQKSTALLKENGIWGFIIPNRLLSNTQLAKLRRNILINTNIKYIFSFKKPVFAAAVDTVILICQKTINDDNIIEVFDDIEDLLRNDFKRASIIQKSFLNNEYAIINLKSSDIFNEISNKIKKASVLLEEIFEVRDGIILGGVKDLFLTNTPMNTFSRKWLEGNEVSRYTTTWRGRYITYDSSINDQEMVRKKDKADSIALSNADYNKIFQSGVRLRRAEIFETPKVLTRQNAQTIIGTFDGDQYFVKNSLHCILNKNNQYNLKYLLGILNSKLMRAFFQNEIGSTGELFSQMKIAYIKKLPIRVIDFNNPFDLLQHNQMVELVEKILDLHQDKTKAHPHQIEMLDRYIHAVDQQIDQLVYQMYGLTVEEIAIVNDV